MQAVILAAGYGSRLERVSGGAPKCLLPIGGAPLIEHQLEALHDAGVGKILVVIGHKADEVRAVLGHRVEFIENTRYSETNSLYSLWLAREWVKGPFVLLNCDLLFHPEILDRLLSKRGSALAYDPTSSKGKEQTKVAISEGRVIDLGKDLQPELARGESLGMISFDADAVHPLFARAHALIQQGAENSWVIEAVRSVCTEVDVKAVNMAGSPWVEIDFPNDYERAIKSVWPAIMKSRWKKTLHWKKTRYAVMFFFVCLFLSIGLFVGSYSAKEEPLSWNNEPLVGAQKVTLQRATGKQKWWLTERGRPLKATLEGPTSARVDVRLLMPPGTTEPGQYVVQVRMDGEPVAWESFKATPEKDDFVAGLEMVPGDRDRVRFSVPTGTHEIEVDLLATTSDIFMGRMSYSEPAIDDEEVDGGPED